MSHVARWRFGRQACFDWCCVVALPIVVEVVRPLITSTRAIFSDRLFLPTSWGGEIVALCACVCARVFERSNGPGSLFCCARCSLVGWLDLVAISFPRSSESVPCCGARGLGNFLLGLAFHFAGGVAAVAFPKACEGRLRRWRHILFWICLACAAHWHNVGLGPAGLR